MGGRQQGHDIPRHTVFLQYLMNQRHLFAVRAVGILASLQYAGVAALETEREYVERYIGTGLVDHADNTEGNAYPTESQTVGQCFLLGDMS